MSRWRKIQRELIEKSIHGEKLDIIQENISNGRITGTYYYKKGTRPSRGILLVHGFSGNRYGMSVLAERLAELGFFCLSIDLPSHFLNITRFTLGELSETITEGVLLIKNHFNIGRMAVIGHSIGAVGALFSNAGYNVAIEKNIYSIWEKIRTIIVDEAKLIIKSKDRNKIMELSNKIDSLYTGLKQLILYSLKKGIQEHSNVTCYVFLAPPTNCKSVIPALSLLKKLKHRTAKIVFENMYHKPAVKQIYKEGNLSGYVPENKKEYIYWQFFKTKDSAGFLDYFLNMKEPIDFLTLVEQVIKLRHKDDMISFFEYYQKKYLLSKPKLFIYGTGDFYLKPFIPSVKRRLENFYESCGNAEIHHGAFSHVMMNNPRQQLAAVAVKNDKVTEMIIRFLYKHM